MRDLIKQILREEVLNESIFFHRRVDFNLIKEMLPNNAQQVYYETENYGQFKYELTLRVVEAIMWNNHKLFWEDLPEQEEIDFVNNVSDIIEKDIKSLYRQYKKRDKRY